MRVSGAPFSTTDFAMLERTEHKGETGTSYWRTRMFGDIRVRIIEYSAGYLTGYWCTKGHVFYCLEGDLEVELKDGRRFQLHPGMSFQVADDAEPHRNRSTGGARFFVVD
jgi:quercetin dioxygenase-like cupin family protein